MIIIKDVKECSTALRSFLPKIIPQIISTPLGPTLGPGSTLGPCRCVVAVGVELKVVCSGSGSSGSGKIKNKNDKDKDKEKDKSKDKDNNNNKDNKDKDKDGIVLARLMTSDRPSLDNLILPTNHTQNQNLNQNQAVAGRWPIPESFWIDSSVDTFVPRPSYPVLLITKASVSTGTGAGVSTGFGTGTRSEEHTSELQSL